MIDERGVDQLLHRAARTTLTYLIAGTLLVVFIILLGIGIEHHIDSLESCVAKSGTWGVVGYVLLFVVLTSLLVPEALLAVLAGVSFGLTWGIAAALCGSFLAAAGEYPGIHR